MKFTKKNIRKSFVNGHFNTSHSHLYKNDDFTNLTNTTVSNTTSSSTSASIQKPTIAPLPLTEGIPNKANTLDTSYIPKITILKPITIFVALLLSPTLFASQIEIRDFSGSYKGEFHLCLDDDGNQSQVKNLKALNLKVTNLRHGQGVSYLDISISERTYLNEGWYTFKPGKDVANGVHQIMGVFGSNKTSEFTNWLVVIDDINQGLTISEDMSDTKDGLCPKGLSSLLVFKKLP